MANIYNKKLNLLEQYRAKQEEKKKSSTKEKNLTSTFCIAGIGILIVLVGSYFGLNAMVNSKQAKLDDINDKLNNPELTEQYDAASAMLDYNAELTAIINAIDTASENIKTLSDYSYLKDTLMTDLKSVTGKNVEITDLSFSNGEMVINLYSKKAINVSEFVSALEEKGVFGNVTYTGFTGDTQNDSNSQFNFELVCKF